MTEKDPLDLLLREWKAPEPGSELDESIVNAFRTANGAAKPKPAWRGFWKARVSVPAPLLVGAMVVVALLLWYRSTPRPTAPAERTGVVTQLNASGFQPLPNGEARVVQVKETH